VVSSVPQFSRSLPGYDPYSISNKAVGYPGKYYDAFSDDQQMYIRLFTLETGKSVIPVMVLSPNRQALDALQHIVDAVVGSVRVAPLKASPIRNTITLADLVGEWHAGSAFSKTYYDRYTGVYAGSSTTAYSARYQVAVKGRNHEQKYHFINFQTAIDGSTVLTVIAGQEDPTKANIAFSQQQLVREPKK
jgi:hypothetical protein